MNRSRPASLLPISPGELLRGLLLFLAALSLVSCAGLGVRSDAEQDFDRGLSLFNKGKYAEAVPHFDRAISLDPNYGVAYLYLGRSYVSLRQWEKALPALRTALRLAPEDTKKEALNVLMDALFSASVSEFHKGNLKSSGKYLDEATELDPFRVDLPSLYRDSQER